ncbi:M15 family metallopeptidase [Magnetococcus sp. PR-3]|uniref:M15 family metallopeptidase n=1 Tax=Magnetococcus sp. PR-3 TaxID=3120355 RepID=UPI002FCE0134
MMQRRHFLQALAVGMMGGANLVSSEAHAARKAVPMPRKTHAYLRDSMDEAEIKEAVRRIRNFNRSHQDDIYLSPQQFALLKRVNYRFSRLEHLVGHANFHLLGFDEAINTAKNYSKVGRFSKKELDFLEDLFFRDAGAYGFNGYKPFTRLTEEIPKREVSKLPYTGNYLYRGTPVRTYEKIRRDVGDKVILTSGVRSVIKQFRLFLNKAEESQGNLSMASRSLAPPGYSFHGIGDFDVGQVGYGYHNFTERFATTEVFKKLRDLGYSNLRYPRDNLLGVRFEPWHIKVLSV